MTEGSREMGSIGSPQKGVSLDGTPGLTDRLGRTSLDDPSKSTQNNSCLTVIVLGASGDLARKKTYPALHKLYEKVLDSFVGSCVKSHIRYNLRVRLNVFRKLVAYIEVFYGFTKSLITLV